MALGGGTYIKQDKVLPGIYINVVSEAARAETASERGVVCVPLVLNWGAKNEIIRVSAEDFEKSSKTIFGYAADAPQMLALRELFTGGARELIAYRVVGSGSASASCTFGTAKYHGTRGNDIKIAVAKDADDTSRYVVTTYLGTEAVDVQIVSAANALVDNAFVAFNKSASLTETAGTAMTGGEDGASLTVSDYQAFLDAAETYGCNVLCCPTANSDVSALFSAYTKRMREERGVRMQCVVYKKPTDYEGVINVDNTVSGFSDENLGVGAYGLVYFVSGISASCALGKSNANRTYTGELTVNTNYTQAALEACLQSGKFVMHNVGGTVRVLDDINGLITFTDEKGESFGYNQTVRAVDALADAVSTKFASEYMGAIPNDDAGRISLWNDICKIIREFESAGVFTGFSTDQVKVSAGEKPQAVVCEIAGLTEAYTMTQLYVRITIS